GRGVEGLVRRRGGAVLVEAGGPAGEDDALKATGQDLGERMGAGEDLGVDGHLADPPRDQLGVLPTEIEDRDLAGAARHGRPATAGARASEPAGRPSLRS